MMQRITLAYQTLSDESKKVVYDRVYDFKFRQQRGSFFSQTDYSQNTTKNKTGEENRVKNLMGQDKDREITHQLLSGAKLIQLGEE